jgi:hypothetical protein
MLRTLLSNLMATALIAHAMIGCCHHHWHRAGETASCDAQVLHVVHSCQCCGHGATFGCEIPCEDDTCDGSACDSSSCGGSTCNGEPCDGQLECQGICSYLPTQRAEVDHSLDAPSFAANLPCDSTAAYLNALDDAALAAVDHHCNSPPPPTLVQLRQLLLI